MSRESSEPTRSLPPEPVGLPGCRSADVTTAGPLAAKPFAGLRVPGYEVLEQLGRGGMGVVYKARQVKADRLVALKMILAGGHATEQDLARFRTEAEAIARLQHPNVVQVFEVGEHDGLPFFSLEFCPGGSLEKKLTGTPLPPREAAALVEVLAGAVQAAHERGIIHRDLKPGNVLLAADGTSRITDFGLAKRLDTGGQTQTGAILGTPSYMAPEQAGGKSRDVGPATDIYALGAVLYECLTGRPPFRAAVPLDTVLQVVSDEPVPPARLNARVPRDLETITLKCLEKVPARRYPSAAALAADLQRFREDRPITARPVGWAGRTWRWCRRNRAVAAAVGSAALCLVLGTVVSAVLAVRATHHAAQARANAEQAAEREQEVRREQARTSAALAAEARRRQQARQALAALTDSVIEDLLARQQDLEPGQKAFLEKVVKLQQEFADDVGEDRESVLAAADGHLQVARIQQRLSRLPESERAYRKALALYRRLEVAGPGGELMRSREATAWNNLGNVLREAGRGQEAEDAFRCALDLTGKERSPGRRVSVASLRTRMNQALEQELAGKLDQAEAGYREVLAGLAPLAAGPAVSTEVLESVAKCRSNLGSALISLRRPKEAVPELEKAIAAFRLLDRHYPGPEHTSGLAKAVHNLGSARAALADPEGAEKAFREAADIEGKLVAAYPGVPEYRMDLANHYDRSATVLRGLGRRTEAEPASRRAVEEAARATRDRPRALTWRELELDYRENLATLLAESGRLGEAEKDERDVVARRQTLVADFPGIGHLTLRVAATRNNLVHMLIDQGRRGEAVREAGETIRLLEAADGRGTGGGSGLLAQALRFRAEAQVGFRRFKEALADCERGLRLSDARSQPWLAFYRACCLARQGRAEEAAASLDGQGDFPAGLTAEAARVYALASAAAKDASRREQWAARAVALLRRALDTAAFREAGRRQALLRDAELETLRTRPDFKALH